MKIICGEMLMPIAKMAKAAKTGLERETTKLHKCIEDTDKLNNAVFYRARRTKNIFHIMQDEITDIKALEVQHEKTTTAQLEAFGREVEDMKLAIST